MDEDVSTERKTWQVHNCEKSKSAHVRVSQQLSSLTDELVGSETLSDRGNRHANGPHPDQICDNPSALSTHKGALISPRKTSHKHNKGLSRLR